MNLSVLKAIGWVKANPLIIGIGALGLFAVLWYFGGSIKQKVLDWKTAAQVERLEKQSDASQQKAAQELSEADKTSGARAAEDERRRNEIIPAIQRSNGNREQARLRTQKAQIDYENSRKKNSDTTGVDLRVLHERNCADFHELYPDEPDCPR